MSCVRTHVGHDLHQFLSKMGEGAEGQQKYKPLVEERAESPLKLWLSADYRGGLWQMLWMFLPSSQTRGFYFLVFFNVNKENEEMPDFGGIPKTGTKSH